MRSKRVFGIIFAVATILGGLTALRVTAPSASRRSPASSPSLPRWSPGELAIGFPLPPHSDRTGLLSLTEQLLPRSVFSLLGDNDSGLHFLFEAPGRDRAYDFIRIVSVRVDPCFETLAPEKEATCTRMIRLVAQVFYPLNPSPAWSDLSDAAVHLFYRLTDTEFVGFLKDLKTLTGGHVDPDGPPGVPAEMLKQGVNGSLATGLNALLGRTTDLAHLVRMTFMATGRNGTNWFFGKIDRDASGQFTVSKIPPALSNIEDAFQQEAPSNPVPDVDSEGIVPPGFRTLNSIQHMDPAMMKSGTDRLLRIENPRLTTTASVSCAACHSANVTLRFALAKKGLKSIPPSELSYEGAAAEALSPPESQDRNSLHSFSYRHEAFIVSPRALHETEASVAFINSQAFVDGLSKDAKDSYLAIPATK